VDPNATARLKVRRIALLAMDRLDLDALCYALSACVRLDARLDILTNLPPDETDSVVIGARGRADTRWRVIRVDGECRNDIFRYARNESGLLFFASSTGDEKALRLRNDFGLNGMPPGISWVMVESR